MCKYRPIGHYLHISCNLLLMRLKAVGCDSDCLNLFIYYVNWRSAAEVHISSVEQFDNLFVGLFRLIGSVVKDKFFCYIWCEFLTDLMIFIAHIQDRERVKYLVFFSFKTLSLGLYECQYLLDILVRSIYYYKCFVIHKFLSFKVSDFRTESVDDLHLEVIEVIRDVDLVVVRIYQTSFARAEVHEGPVVEFLLLQQSV